MNEKGKLNLGVILVGLLAVTVISIGMFAVSSQATDDAIPKAPIMQAEGSGDAPAANDDSEEPADITSEESQTEEEVADESAPPPSDGEPVEDTSGKTHRELTPRELSSLGIFYLDDEGSPVAERTKAILDVHLPSAMQRKNDEARSYQTMNMEGRLDPLYITDLIPDGLRPDLEGEGISGAVDSGLIDQLIQTQISTIFKYMPINIIGTMQNGPYKSALVHIPALGFYRILKEGEGFQIPAFGGEQGYYIIHMTVTKISEDHVTIVLGATLVDYVYGRALASTPSVTRHFYIRRYQ